jgi:hypothetical protein
MRCGPNGPSRRGQTNKAKAIWDALSVTCGRHRSCRLVLGESGWRHVQNNPPRHIIGVFRVGWEQGTFGIVAGQVTVGLVAVNKPRTLEATPSCGDTGAGGRMSPGVLVDMGKLKMKRA